MLCIVNKESEIERVLSIFEEYIKTGLCFDLAWVDKLLEEIEGSKE